MRTKVTNCVVVILVLAFFTAAGVALAMGRPDILEKITPKHKTKVLDYLIDYGLAINGITFRQEHSVDGIEFDDYMKIIERIKEIVFE